MKNKDEQILLYLNECPLLTRSHIGKLAGRDNSYLNESLRRMVRQKKIHYKPRGRWLPTVYALHDIRKRESFDHDLPLADIYTALKQTGRLAEWCQPRQKFEGELNEDITFYFACGNSQIKYYLEYETGKNAWWQVDAKFARYILRRREEQFNVLFVLKDEALKTIKQMTSRAQKFVDKGRPVTWKLFLFTTLSEITANPLGRICATAYDARTYPIAPDLL